MTDIPADLQTFQIGQQIIQAYVPDPVAVREHYRRYPADFPYWSQVWPSSLALCHFLEQNIDYLKKNTVLELAAGLGLPSLLAAGFAGSVVCSDYLAEAVAIQRRSIAYNKLENLQSSLIDWKHLPPALTADLLLLSDVNYEPANFATVSGVIRRFTGQGSTVILSTPQRLMAKPFIEELLSLCIRKEEILLSQKADLVPVTILVLQG